jgi:hypothetical protein
LELQLQLHPETSNDKHVQMLKIELANKGFIVKEPDSA